MAPPKTQRLLLKGVQGDDVRDAQRKLNFRLDPSKRIDEDGIFGDNTDTAVRDFQRRNTLSVDGRIGPQTWNALNTKIAVVMVKVDDRGPIRPLLDTMIDRGLQSLPPSPPPSSGLSEAWKRRFIERHSQGPYLNFGSVGGDTSTGSDQIYQVQGQFGRTFKPWIDWRHPRGAPPSDASNSWAALVAMTWRTSQDDGHLEYGPLLQINRSYTDPKRTAQIAFQVLWADLLHHNRYHLASFYFQPSVTLPLLDNPDWVIGASLGYQAQVEVGGENCSIFVQGQLVGAIDLNTREFTFGAGVVVGASVNIPSSSDKLHWNVCKSW
jgi:hypothetical protein